MNDDIREASRRLQAYAHLVMHLNSRLDMPPQFAADPEEIDALSDRLRAARYVPATPLTDAAGDLRLAAEKMLRHIDNCRDNDDLMECRKALVQAIAKAERGQLTREEMP